MPLYEPIIPVRYVRPLLALVKPQRPADIAAILQAGGISDTELRGTSKGLQIWLSMPAPPHSARCCNRRATSGACRR